MRSEYVTICITPLLCSGGGKKFRPPPERGTSRLPNTGSASAYPCARDIIARFVEFGKVRNCLPPPRGKVPPQGAERDSVPPSPKPSPGGRWHGAAVTDEGKAKGLTVLLSKRASIGSFPLIPLQCTHWRDLLPGEGFFIPYPKVPSHGPGPDRRRPPCPSGAAPPPPGG